jgi:hypothetical protein
MSRRHTTAGAARSPRAEARTFVAYSAALEREEHAADGYRQRTERAWSPRSRESGRLAGGWLMMRRTGPGLNACVRRRYSLPGTPTCIALRHYLLDAQGPASLLRKDLISGTPWGA